MKVKGGEEKTLERVRLFFLKKKWLKTNVLSRNERKEDEEKIKKTRRKIHGGKGGNKTEEKSNDKKGQK